MNCVSCDLTRALNQRAKRSIGHCKHHQRRALSSSKTTCCSSVLFLASFFLRRASCTASISR